jgi:hypothetical protein
LFNVSFLFSIIEMHSSIFLVAFCFIVLPSFVSAGIKRVDAPIRLPQVQPVKGPQFDGCPYCVDFMDNAINDLLNALLNDGVIGGCAGLCAFVPDQLLEVACNFICDYVGIEIFVEAINVTDPDPIYICQEIEFCPVVNGGQVKITKAVVSPSSGPAGTQFNITMFYNVIQPTGPGLLVVVVNPPANSPDMPFGGEDFTEGQAIGSYGVAWQLDSTPSESESFQPGNYGVIVAVCEGDCTNSHPYGGVYAQAAAQFSITN